MRPPPSTLSFAVLGCIIVCMLVGTGAFEGSEQSQQPITYHSFIEDPVHSGATAPRTTHLLLPPTAENESSHGAGILSLSVTMVSILMLGALILCLGVLQKPFGSFGFLLSQRAHPILSEIVFSFLICIVASQIAIFLISDESSATDIFVNTTDDSGPGSLRAAITTANSNGEADTIIVDPALAGE